MSYSKLTVQVKAMRRSSSSRIILYITLALISLSALLTSQNILAMGSNFDNINVEQVGSAQQTVAMDFYHAQIAFENKDFEYSSRLLTLLATKGHIQAQYMLATQYDAGLGIVKNERASFYWYKKAALAGVNIAQHNLAVAYAQGNGVTSDLTKAITWWKRAAQSGNTDSQYNLGIIYAAGRDEVKPDLIKALKWWHMAAKNGDAAAQFNLGALYANGHGKLDQACEASRWLKKSAENGFTQAAMALAVLETKSQYSVCQ